MARGMASEDVLRALRSVELFARLDDAVLAQLASVVRQRSYGRGQLVFVEGDPGDSLLVLVSGSVTVFRTAPSGERAGLAVLEPPEVLGEVSLLDGAPRSASVEATAPTVALAVSRAEFLALLRSQPSVLEPLLHALGTMVRRLTDQAADHVFLDLAGRVAKALLRLAPPTPSGLPPSVAITQSRLAEMSGGTRQSVNQVLGGFSTRGLVHLEGRRILLTDVAGLRRRAHLPPEEVTPPGGRPASRPGRTPVAPATAGRGR
jgi:CRP/FNR family cyclic AMP-dependent transcriptional regulator